ncbi:MAG TPA: pantoate--beta-alanine ligase [Bacteroidales bacterium]|nr:pantoate--beta-alanine ligase [Bacteroidales bacterium]
MTQVITQLNDWRLIRQQIAGRSIGFVPTMGALHQGHVALFERSLASNDITVGSIFVNPTQFNNPDDLRSYPHPYEKDLEILTRLKVDYLLYPTFDQIYADGYAYKISESEFSNQLCGKYRPGHFEGVLTVVMKLFNLVRPTRAYFGEKDYQQLSLIKRMVDAFFMDIEIVPVPTVRDDDGLALSSRNQRLSREERQKAPIFHRLLSSGLPPENIKTELTRNGFQVDYIEQHGNRILGAVFLGNIRLIDNVEI